MRTQRMIAGIAVACLMALSAPQTAFAGLQINLVYIENPPQPESELVKGGGQLREIMQVAAENWERIFRRGGGNWKVTIEYGWGGLVSSLYAQEYKISEAGNNPSRIGHSCILFNTNPKLEKPLQGFCRRPPFPQATARVSSTTTIARPPSGWGCRSSISGWRGAPCGFSAIAVRFRQDGQPAPLGIRLSSADRRQSKGKRT